MDLNKLKINGIPAILWGEPSDQMIIAAHGSHSSKIDDCMWVLAEEAIQKGYQVLSFDLPQHGERVYDTDCIMPDTCVQELTALYHFCRERARKSPCLAAVWGPILNCLPLRIWL